jgi:23S rRNA (uracil1939-C5)-methyltransferase
MSQLCPIAGLCQNCDWIDLSAAEAAQRLCTIIQNRFQHPVDEFHPSPARTHYRSRIQLRPNKEGQLSYSQPRSTLNIPIEDCSIADPLINAALKKLGPCPKGVQRVEFRTNGQLLQLSAQSKRQDQSLKKALVAWAEPTSDSIALNGQILHGIKRMPYTFGGVQHQLRPQSFTQVNLPLNEQLISRVVSLAHEQNPSQILDLYSGVGNFSFPLASTGIPVIAMESAPSSVYDARDTQERTQLPVEIQVKNIDTFAAGDVFCEVVILDPPRSGAPGIFPKLTLTLPKRIIYISCFPQSLARDMKSLGSKYKLSRIEVFEMFPQTHHGEVLAVFDKV